MFLFLVKALSCLFFLNAINILKSETFYFLGFCELANNDSEALNTKNYIHAYSTFKPHVERALLVKILQILTMSQN